MDRKVINKRRLVFELVSIVIIFVFLAISLYRAQYSTAQIFQEANPVSQGTYNEYSCEVLRLFSVQDRSRVDLYKMVVVIDNERRTLDIDELFYTQLIEGDRLKVIFYTYKNEDGGIYDRVSSIEVVSSYLGGDKYNK